MPNKRFLPSRLDQAFLRLAENDVTKSLFAAAVGNPQYCTWFDHFVGQSAGTWPASANWGYPATIGTGTEVIGIKANAIGGALTLTTGGNASDGAYQTVGRHWNGTNGFYFIAKFNLDTITTAKFEVGMTDSVTAEGAIATKATPTFTATTAAVFAFDTTDDTNVTFITAAAGVVGANVDWAGLAAGTDITVEIKGEGGFASGYINGRHIGGGAITAGTALTPILGCTTRTTATRTLTVDYAGCIGPVT